MQDCVVAVKLFFALLLPLAGVLVLSAGASHSNEWYELSWIRVIYSTRTYIRPRMYTTAPRNTRPGFVGRYVPCFWRFEVPHTDALYGTSGTL